MSHVSEREIALVAHMAREIRVNVIYMLAEAGSGHLARSLSVADIMAILYVDTLRYDPLNPGWNERDRFVLSCGQLAPAWYASLALTGSFPVGALMTWCQFGSSLQDVPEHTRASGVEITTGLWGEGLSQAIGIAHAGIMDQMPYHVYALTSDEEHDSGVLWEAVKSAAQHNLTNVTNIVLRTGADKGGATERDVSIELLVRQYESFGWRVCTVDAHHIEMGMEVLRNARNTRGQPMAIIAQAVPGKGVHEIEGDLAWYDRVPSHEEAHRWVSELNAGKYTT